MKTILIKIALLFMSTCLITSCSSRNTENENIGVGTVAGAVAGGLAGSLIGQGTGRLVAVGVGTLVGGMIGGGIGKSMDSVDKANTYRALDNNATYVSTDWKNEKTKVYYTITPTSKKFTFQGNPNCRKFNATAVTNNKIYKSHGIICRGTNGNWQTAE